MSTKNLDVRGLACPEPLMAFMQAAKDAATDTIEITFDCAPARDNITRGANSIGWQVDSVTENADHAVMVLSRK